MLYDEMQAKNRVKLASKFSTMLLSVIIFLCVKFHPRRESLLLSPEIRCLCDFVVDYRAVRLQTRLEIWLIFAHFKKTRSSILHSTVSDNTSSTHTNWKNWFPSQIIFQTCKTKFPWKAPNQVQERRQETWGSATPNASKDWKSSLKIFRSFFQNVCNLVVRKKRASRCFKTFSKWIPRALFSTLFWKWTK